MDLYLVKQNYSKNKVDVYNGSNGVFTVGQCQPVVYSAVVFSPFWIIDPFKKPI